MQELLVLDQALLFIFNQKAWIPFTTWTNFEYRAVKPVHILWERTTKTCLAPVIYPAGELLQLE